MTSSEPQVVVVTGASGGIGRATVKEELRWLRPSVSTVVWQAEVDSWAVSILPSAEIGRNTIAAREQFDLAAEAAPQPAPVACAIFKNGCGHSVRDS